MWDKEERYRRGKKVWHTTENRYRVSCTHAALHYESQIDSGNYDTEIDLAFRNVQTNRLGGLTANSGYEFGYQDRDATNVQKPLGAFGFGGRKGEAFFNLRPYRLGYLNTVTRDFQSITSDPNFTTPTVTSDIKQIGIRGDSPIHAPDDNPALWNIRCGGKIDLGELWPRTNFTLKLSGGQIEPVVTIPNWKALIGRELSRDRPANVSFGVLMQVSLNDIARIYAGGTEKNRLSDDISWSNDLILMNSSRKPLAHIGAGQVSISRRGGRVQIVKRMWRDNAGQWWFFMGANLAQMQSNLLEGTLVIDPPISEESIAANADDASQSGTYMRLSGFGASNELFMGGGSSYHFGGIFQSVPIGNGDTITTATYEPLQNRATSNATATLFGIDEDNAAAFTTSANNLTGRADTSASTALTSADMGGNGVRAAWDVSGQVAEITVRGGWNTGQRLGFTVIGAGASGYNAFLDYSNSAANAADFNADVSVSDILLPQVMM